MSGIEIFAVGVGLAILATLGVFVWRFTRP